jgi:hypothetical protein
MIEKKQDNVLHRFEDVVYAAMLDEYEDRSGYVRVGINHKTYTILKVTKCGAWIDVYGKRKFVNLEARKKFACKTRDDALISFLARKSAQERILKAKLKNNQAAIVLAMKMKNGFFT